MRCRQYTSSSHATTPESNKSVEIKIIVMTVHDEDAYRQAAEASGADAFLLKKTLVTDLLPTIQRLHGSLAPPQASQDNAPPGHGR